MSYPALIYVHPTLTVNGEIIPEGQYTIRYTWTNREGLIVRNVNTEYNVMAVYKELPGSNVYLDCTATATYNGQTYTAFTKWTNLYRASDPGSPSNSNPGNPSNPNTNNPSSSDGRQVTLLFRNPRGTPVDNITVTAGGTYGPLPIPIRPGYQFLYWETGANVPVYENSTVTATGSTQMLFAKWEKLDDDSSTTTTPGTTPATPTTPTSPADSGTQETEASLAQAAAAAFSDVSRGDFFDASVGWALKNQITNGTSSTEFSPYENCTQTQILTFLYRAAQGGAATAEDMTHAVNWARDKGMIDASFNGNAPCTRATAVTYIWQAFGSPSAGGNGFSDVTAGSACAGAVSWAVQKNVTTGTSETTFSPDKVCSRGEIVTFLYRAYH